MTQAPAAPPAPKTVSLFPLDGVQGALPGLYARLSELLTASFVDNPKKHQPELIEYSIGQYGFNDSLELDVERNILVAGHGRCESLDRMRLAGKPVPGHIILLEGGDWAVPVTPLHFASPQAMAQYLLLNNRAGVTRLSPEDYDGVKLNKVLREAMAGAGTQDVLPGFSDEDRMMGGSVTGTLVPPPLPAFDAQGAFEPGRLEGGMVHQEGQAPQSWVALVTFPDHASLKRGIRALTLGARTALSEDARQASVEGSALLADWEARLLGENAAQAAQVKPASSGALPGQITLAGAVIGEKPSNIPLMPPTPAAHIDALVARAAAPHTQARTLLLAATFADGAPGSEAWAAQASFGPPPQHQEEEESFEGGLDPAMEDDAFPPLAAVSDDDAAAVVRAIEALQNTPVTTPVAHSPAVAAPARPVAPAVAAGPYAGLPIPAVAKVVPNPVQASMLPEMPLVVEGKSKRPAKHTAVAEIVTHPDAPAGAKPAPHWVGGLCPDCGGSAHHGFRGKGEARQPVPCITCDSTGYQEAWLKKQGLA